MVYVCTMVRYRTCINNWVCFIGNVTYHHAIVCDWCFIYVRFNWYRNKWDSNVLFCSNYLSLSNTRAHIIIIVLYQYRFASFVLWTDAKPDSITNYKNEVISAIRYINSMLIWSWPTACDACPTFSQLYARWVTCLFFNPNLLYFIWFIILVWCWATICDAEHQTNTVVL